MTNELTATIDTGQCEYCDGQHGRASFEDGEWVCYSCGLPLPDDVGEVAEKKLAKGDGEYNHSERRAEQIVSEISEVLQS